jgi:6-phosphogluconate dehydrogenase
MVYNGIEYSIMQLIPAAYEIAKVFAAFHKTGLNSYLFAANGRCEKAKMEEK